MHNKYATFVLPVLAGLAIVGAGFSTWVFANSNSVSATATGTITVESISDSAFPAGKVTLGYGTTDSNALSLSASFGSTSVSFGMTLDQDYENGNATNNSYGITVTENHDSYDFMWELESTTAAGYTNYDVTVKYSVAVSYGSGVSDHISFQGAKSDAVALTRTKITASGVKVIVPDAISNVWHYVSKPTNSSAYFAMSESCAGKTVTITLTVTAEYSLHTGA